jgi:O-antigen/teichoic acid export membrane protein
VTFLFNLYFVRRFIQLRLEYDWKYWKHIASQAFPIGLVLIFGFVYYKIDSIMLSVLRGMVDVGVYGTAYKLLEVLQTVPSMFLGAAFPLITKYAESKDKRLRGAFQKQFDFLVLIAVPLVIGTFVLAGPIISLIAGSKGSEFLHTSTVTFFGQQITSVTCLKILIFSVGVSFISQLYNYMIVSLGKQKVMIWPTVGFAAFNFLVNLYLIPRYSYLGASVSTLATEMIVCATYYHYTRKFVVLPVALFAAAKVLFAGLLMGAVIYWLNAIGINIFIMVAVAVAVYAFFIMVFGAVPYDMIRQVTRGGQE